MLNTYQEAKRLMEELEREKQAEREKAARPKTARPPTAAEKNGHAPDKRFKFLTIAELLKQERLKWLIEDLIHEMSFVQFFGQTSHGKSLLVLDLALNICKGSATWFGRRILRHGPVAWINADGGAGLRDRVEAWIAANGGDFHYEFHTLQGGVQLNHNGQMITFREEIAAMDPKPVLVVFDTLSRCIPGVDENLQGEMTRVTDNCHLLKLEIGCCPVLIHHTDKTGQHDRGSSIVKNETDTQIRVTMDEDTKIATVHSCKAREAERFKDFHFSLKPAAKSVYIVQHGDGPAKTAKEKKISKETQMLTIVCNEPGVTCETCSNRLDRALRTVQRYAEEMERSGLLRRVQIPGGKEGRPEFSLYPTAKGKLATGVDDSGANSEEEEE